MGVRTYFPVCMDVVDDSDTRLGVVKVGGGGATRPPGRTCKDCPVAAMTDACHQPRFTIKLQL